MQVNISRLEVMFIENEPSGEPVTGK